MFKEYTADQISDLMLEKLSAFHDEDPKNELLTHALTIQTSIEQLRKIEAATNLDQLLLDKEMSRLVDLRNKLTEQGHYLTLARNAADHE
jgi:hypothetical protein